MSTMDYKDIQYQKSNIRSIKDLTEANKSDTKLKNLLNKLQEHLAENHESLVEEIILGKKDKGKLESVINDWLMENRDTQGYFKEALTKQLIDNIVGWGKLQPLIEDKSVTNIFTNEKLEVIKRVKGEDVKTNIKFESDEELETFIRSIMIRTGEKINHNICIKDGMDHVNRVRINAGIYGSPLKKEVVRRPYLALRTYRVEDFSRDFFIQNGTFDEEIADFIDKIANSNIAIVGEPDAGKTTLIEYIEKVKKVREPMRRVIRIEEEAELAFEAENSVSFFERKTSDNKDDERKKYDMAEFAKQATRLAGKDVIIGEVRGAEAWYLLRLLSMGYIALYSIHGNSAAEGIYQTAFLMSLAAPNARMDMLIQRVSEIIDFVIYVSHKKVVTIAEVTGYDHETGTPQLNEIFNLKIGQDEKLYWETKPLSMKYQEQMKIKTALMKRKV